MQKCLLIINPKAGQQRIGNKLLEIIQKLNQQGYVVNTFITSKKENARYAIDNVYNGEQLVLCAGGDGTLSQTVSGLVKNEINVQVGYIPCGSTNDYATTLNFPKNILKSIDNVINGSEQCYDIGNIVSISSNNIVSSNFVYVAAFGLFSSASYETPQNAKNIFGPLAYMFNGVAELVDATSYHVKMEIDEEYVEDNFMMGIVANTLSIGGVMKLNKCNVDLQDGLFEILLVKKPTTIQEFDMVINGFVEQDFDSKMFVYKKAKHIYCTFDNDITWSLDGEPSCLANVFEIDNLQQKLRLRTK